MGKEILLNAKPEPLKIDPTRTAVIVVDMQNGFASKGGMMDILGKDLSSVRRAIEPCRNVIRKARAKGCKIIYLQQCYARDLSNSGGEHSPNWLKSKSLVFIRDHPELKDSVLFENTWGSAIIEELKPEEGSIIVKKQRFNGFVGTNLELVLKTYDIKYLVFIGTVVNICVESTLRDAFFHDYFCILISDALGATGPDFVTEATLYNVQLVFGWVMESATFCECLD